MIDLSCQGVFIRAFINLKTGGAEIERGLGVWGVIHFFSFKQGKKYLANNELI